MKALAPPAASLPSVFLARPEARTRVRDFFGSHIRNPNTRRAYREAARQFSAFCAANGIEDLGVGLGGDLVAGGEDAVGSGGEVAFMDGFDLPGLFAQDVRRPERAGEVAAELFQFGGHASVEDADAGEIELAGRGHSMRIGFRLG
jgi:hypothetical protein